MTDVTKQKTTKAAQVAVSQKAAALKAENAEKRAAQPVWLRGVRRLPPPMVNEAGRLSIPERLRASDQSQAPPYLLSKSEILATTNVSFPTIWAWMRAGTFPRSRVVGGKSMWLSNEVAEWMATLPVRRLKGDDGNVQSQRGDVR
jgi:predicted DNA-binding transcriptional regulator AlpA